MREAKVAPDGARDSDDRERLHARLAEMFPRYTRNPAICVVDGFGVSLGVERGRLVVRDGLGTNRRERRYARATHGLARIVVLSADGSVSLEALRWCEGADVGVVVLDPFSGDLLLTSGGTGNNDPRLRRSQALAMGTETGLEIARYLVSAKLAGQAAVAATHLDSSSAVETISTLGEMASEAGSLEEARQLEAAAASAYFAAWSSLRVPFVRRDAARVPEHWLVFEGRRSAVNVGTSRSATDPLNALLNYSYRLVEAEGRLAYLAIGLDPGLGVLHADVKGRDSLVLDVMEAVRPEADRFVLKLVEGRPLLKTDFAEDRRGVLRLLPPLSHRMAEAMPSYARALGPVVEHVATLLASASPYDPAVPSVLTQSKHKAVARRMVETAEPLQRRVAGPNPGGLSPRAKRRQQARRSDQPTLPFAICRGCGADLPVVAPYATPQRRWCDACLPQFRKEEGERLSNEGRAAAEATRAVTGTLPSHDSEAQARRRESNRRERLSRLSWEDEHRATRDTHWYLSSIAPRLSAVSLRAISSATGVSLSAASKFRRGIHVPAPRHWGALAVLVGVASPREP